jgi:hypothetical protein
MLHYNSGMSRNIIAILIGALTCPTSSGTAQTFKTIYQLGYAAIRPPVAVQGGDFYGVDTRSVFQLTPPTAVRIARIRRPRATIEIARS